MVEYTFECDTCEIASTFQGHMHTPHTHMWCIECLNLMRRVYGANVYSFKPYKAHCFGEDPVQVESRKQREVLCDRHEVTYDTGRYVRRPMARAGRESAVDAVTLGDVKQAIDRGGLESHESGVDELSDTG